MNLLFLRIFFNYKKKNNNTFKLVPGNCTFCSNSKLDTDPLYSVFGSLEKVTKPNGKRLNLVGTEIGTCQTDCSIGTGPFCTDICASEGLIFFFFSFLKTSVCFFFVVFFCQKLNLVHGFLNDSNQQQQQHVFLDLLLLELPVFHQSLRWLVRSSLVFRFTFVIFFFSLSFSFLVVFFFFFFCFFFFFSKNPF